MKAKIILNKTYYNPFLETSFTVIEELDDRVRCKYENGMVKDWDRKELKKFIQNTIDRKLKNWEMNIQFKSFWTLDVINSGITDVNNIMEKMQDVIIEEEQEWVDSKFLTFKSLPPQTKGAKACEVFCCYLESLGKDVAKNEDYEYDFDIHRVIEADGKRTIIRCACVDSRTKGLNLNHIRDEGDWERLICFLVFPDRIELWEADKDLIYLHLEENPREIVWLIKDEMKNIHWNLSYPLPDIFSALTEYSEETL